MEELNELLCGMDNAQFLELLEYAEISLRTLCDLIRYQQLKELGVVHSAKEFIQLFHPDEQEDTP